MRVDEMRGDGGLAEGVAPALDVAAHQERRDRLVDLHQRARAARPHDGEMEGVVGLAALLRVVERIDQRVEHAGQRLQVALARPLAGETNGLALDGDAGLQHVVQDVGLGRQAERQRLAQHRGVGRAHEGAAAVLDVEQAQHGERPQRLAQHRPADAQRQRELALGQQPVACLQFARQQLVAKEGEDPGGAARRFVVFRSNNVEYSQVFHLVSPWSDHSRPAADRPATGDRGSQRLPGPSNCHGNDATFRPRKRWSVAGGLSARVGARCHRKPKIPAHEPRWCCD